MAEPKAEKPKTEKSAGAWVVVDDGGVVQSVERSELRALRIATGMKARVVRWQFGKPRTEVLP